MKGRFWFASGLFLGVSVACAVGMLMAGPVPWLLQRQVLAGVMGVTTLIAIATLLSHGPILPIRITDRMKPGTPIIVAIIRSGGKVILISEKRSSSTAPYWTVHVLDYGDVVDCPEQFVGRWKRFLVTPHERISGVVHIAPVGASS